ncbi:MAG: hypothetical protein OMM_08283 [Candidatus Magnetoglobus multicellularis str. Araruama]|uniref:Uncharacterized protein n=1 Tax=Candidatus Magnetoglobus multicellularis str. Araruama TaxID=890399 RepID=A0A1V1P901_9BACT|nr:MAG: hypothetical protein OMM_08283 [Candidatus Magnetoglobus multicellularis str. Araruama]
MKKNIQTDLNAIDTMSDDMIDTSDIPELTEKFFSTAKWRIPKSTVKVTIEIEPDVLYWYKSVSTNYQQQLAAALRLYAYAHQKGFSF